MRVAFVQLLALLFEAVLNGILCTLFCILVLSFIHSGLPCRIYRGTLIPVACTMVALSLTHLALGFVRATQAFTLGLDPEEYYARFGRPLQTAKTSLFIAQTMLGDGVIVWRCYVVYNGNKLFLIFSLLPLGFNLATGVLAALELRKDAAISITTSHWFAAYFSITLVINLLCSAAVVYRIYQSSYDIQAYKKALPIMGTIIKSGALYAAGVLGVLISYLVRSKGVYLALDILVPLVGIVFLMIALQIHFHLNNTRNAEISSNLPTLGTLPQWRHFFPNSDHQVITDPRIPSHESVDRVSIISVTRTKAPSDHFDTPIR